MRSSLITPEEPVELLLWLSASRVGDTALNHFRYCKAAEATATGIAAQTRYLAVELTPSERSRSLSQNGKRTKSLMIHRHNQKSCDLCGQKKFQVLYLLDGFQIIRCQRCGLVSTNLGLNRTDLEAMYAPSYYQERWEYYFGNSVINNTVTEENTNIRDFRRGLSLIEQFKDRGKLLDVGCALGIFLYLAKEQGWEVHGVDISRYAASYAREVLGFEVFAGNLEEAQFPEKSFDVITLWDVLEHFPNPSRQLQEIRRLLKDDGVIFMNTPNEEGLLRLLAHIIFRLSGGKITYPIRKLYHRFHLYYFTQRTLQALLEKNGFVLVRLDKSCIPIIKARGRPLERLIVKVLSWPELLCHREFELLAIARKRE